MGIKIFWNSQDLKRLLYKDEKIKSLSRFVIPRYTHLSFSMIVKLKITNLLYCECNSLLLVLIVLVIVVVVLSVVVLLLIVVVELVLSILSVDVVKSVMVVVFVVLVALIGVTKSKKNIH